MPKPRRGDASRRGHKSHRSRDRYSGSKGASYKKRNKPMHRRDDYYRYSASYSEDEEDWDHGHHNGYYQSVSGEYDDSYDKPGRKKPEDPFKTLKGVRLLVGQVRAGVRKVLTKLERLSEQLGYEAEIRDYYFDRHDHAIHNVDLLWVMTELKIYDKRARFPRVTILGVWYHERTRKKDLFNNFFKNFWNNNRRSSSGIVPAIHDHQVTLIESIIQGKEIRLYAKNRSGGIEDRRTETWKADGVMQVIPSQVTIPKKLQQREQYENLFELNQAVRNWFNHICREKLSKDILLPYLEQVIDSKVDDLCHKYRDCDHELPEHLIHTANHPKCPHHSRMIFGERAVRIAHAKDFKRNYLKDTRYIPLFTDMRTDGYDSGNLSGGVKDGHTEPDRTEIEGSDSENDYIGDRTFRDVRQRMLDHSLSQREHGRWEHCTCKK